jgi:hypothetical protein
MLRSAFLLPALVLAAVIALPLALTAGSPAGVTARADLTRAQATPDADSPAGFYYGTDSWPIAINSPAPYREPDISRNPVYGGYIGMAGNWAPVVGLRRQHRLVVRGQLGGQHQLQQVRQGHRHRRLLVHGRPRR